MFHNCFSICVTNDFNTRILFFLYLISVRYMTILKQIFLFISYLIYLLPVLYMLYVLFSSLL